MHDETATPRQNRLSTIPDVATDLSLSVRSVWRLIRQRELTVVRCGRATRIDRSSVDRFIERGGTGGGRP